MKARVKATGEIIDVAYTYKTVGKNPTTKCETLKGERYNEDDLDFNIEDDNTPDYWTRLEHTYAGMAMQGILSNPELFKATAKNAEEFGLIVPQAVAIDANCFAHALVQKLKEKEERK